MKNLNDPIDESSRQEYQPLSSKPANEVAENELEEKEIAQDLKPQQDAQRITETPPTDTFQFNTTTNDISESTPHYEYDDDNPFGDDWDRKSIHSNCALIPNNNTLAKLLSAGLIIASSTITYLNASHPITSAAIGTFLTTHPAVLAMLIVGVVIGAAYLGFSCVNKYRTHRLFIISNKKEQESSVYKIAEPTLLAAS